MTEFVSDTSELAAFDPATRTLSVRQRPERDGLAVHSFEFSARLPESVDEVTVCIENAGATQYSGAWAHHVPYQCTDGEWAPIAGRPRYDQGRYSFSVPVRDRRVHVAWYPPYSLDDVEEFIERTFGGHPYASVDRGEGGHLTIGLGNVRAPAIVVVARQHPGESIGSFVLEGMVGRLLADTHEARRLLESFRFVVVPAVNLDGMQSHLHRHDSHGRDINRSWALRVDPTDVAVVKAVIDKLPDVFAFVDVHGDEVSRVNFVNYAIGKTSKDRRLQYERLVQSLVSQDPQLLVWKSLSFPKRFAKALIRQHKLIRPGAKTANAFVAGRHHTLALTVEPSVHLLTPERARALGAWIASSLSTVATSVETAS
jgi:hypothetical protein